MTLSEKIHSFDVEDVEYLRHQNKPLLARLFKPSGDGPFPAVVEIHGGGWNEFDRTRGKSVHETLARSGVLVVALDFRQGDEGAYPLSVADINYGVRWVKANSGSLKVSADHVGISGNSSGGHLAMLVAMRPNDPRYASIPLPPGSPEVDATVRCVVMLWPVINPLGRYRHARRLQASDSPAKWPGMIVAFHDSYWRSEANMADGNPMLALERGENVTTPPSLWIQTLNDDVHNYKDLDSQFPGKEAERFVANYRKAGGEIDIEYFDAPSMFTTVHPTLPESVAAMKKIVSFVHRYCG